MGKLHTAVKRLYVNLIVCLVAQALLCALSTIFVFVFAAGLAPFAGQFAIPVSLGLFWALVTGWLITKARIKMPLVVIGFIELPFAFGWPAWAAFIWLLAVRAGK
jgi:hypothetical protein